MRLTCSAVFGLLAIIFTGCVDTTNPPVTREVQWDSARTEELATVACMPCHSNETHWNWYASLPGVGHALTSEAAVARSKMNFSTWDQPQEEYEDAPEKVLSAEMPPATFLMAYPNARLTDDERQALADGLLRTFNADPPPGGSVESDD